MKLLRRCIAGVAVALFASLTYAACPSCCSSHGGITNSRPFNGNVLCADGTASATCTCSFPTDFNGGGKDDIVWSNSSTGSKLAWIMAGGSIVNSSILLTDPAWSIVQYGDFNGDGRTDLLLAQQRYGPR